MKYYIINLGYLNTTKYNELFIPFGSPYEDEKPQMGKSIQTYELPIIFEADNKYKIKDYPLTCRYQLYSNKFVKIMKRIVFE